MTNGEALKIITSFPTDHYAGVTTVSLGRKITGGEVLSSPSIIFGVEKKLPLKDIPRDQLLPASIVTQDASGQTTEHLTDVVEDNISWEFEGYCYKSGTANNPVPSHKMRHRPITGGISIGNYTYDTQSGKKKVGTLGAIVIDAIDGQIVGLTNNHVITPNVYRVASNQTSSYNYDNNNITQPAQEYGSGDPQNNIIGKAKRSYPIEKRNNYIDAGIFTIDTGIDRESLEQLGHTADIVVSAFATTAEIDNMLEAGTQLFKSSRSTGPVGSPGALSTCSLYADRLSYSNARVSGNYFNDLVRYTGSIDPSTGGDSGSMVYGLFSGEWKAVGLHMAGGRSKGVDFGIFCRIDRIAGLLMVRPFTESEAASISDTSTTSVNYTPEYKVIEGYSSDFYIYDGSDIYWQLGRTGQPVTE